MQLVQPWKVPKLGRGGTPASRIAMLHSLVHIEGSAVNLAWDVIARFAPAGGLPRAFCHDFVAVAQDEARHFSILEVGACPLQSRAALRYAHCQSGFCCGASRLPAACRARRDDFTTVAQDGTCSTASSRYVRLWVMRLALL